MAQEALKVRTEEGGGGDDAPIVGSEEQGISSEEAKRKLLEFGPNLIEGKKRTPLIFQFLAQFKDFMVIILIVASIFAYFADEAVDATIIICIVILNALIGFVQEFKAEKAIEALKKLLAPRARVLRDGGELMIDAKYLVPGDLVILAEGDKVSADCALVEENEIYIDESILTGESVPVKKDAQKRNKIFMGTQITHGTGRAVVLATGMRTEFGKIATLTTETKKDKSPLQKELGHIGALVGKLTIGICVVLFLIVYFIQKREIIDTLLFSVSVAVAAVPEGLPATITVALALGVQRLAKKNAIVKQLASVETLGSTTVICSDKTGTLTKNEMTVKEIVIDNYDISVSGVGYEPSGTFTVHSYGKENSESFDYTKDNVADLAFKKPKFYQHFELAIRAAAFCNDSKLTSVDGRWSILGDPTEGALVVLAEKAGLTMHNIFNKYKRIGEIPFDSQRRRMAVIAKETETGKINAYVKGAPDSMLDLCTHIFKDGRIVELDKKIKENLLKRTESMASKALRTIAVAYKELPKIQEKYKEEEVECNLVFLGIFAMIDPPREEVKEAVKLTHKAGIRVFIITGDHGLTAHAIAKELGIVKSYGVNIVTGEMLDKMSDSKLKTLVARGQETIFARSNPEHKLRIVNTLKQMDEVVAVTGDGVNDAPALKRADIGIAMGITGTDVSKEAANMVLTDDSFGTIISAVVEGRTIYENMKKFIAYIFASNIGELVAIFSALAIGVPAPLTAVFILIINTLTDVFPSLALGVEPVEKTVLEHPPRKPDAKIMEWPFILRCLINGFIMGTTTVAVFFWNLFDHGWEFGQILKTDSVLYMESATMSFVVLTFLQMVHSFSNRSATVSMLRMKLFGNPYLVAAVAFSITATVLCVQVGFFERYLKTTALDAKQWIIVCALAFVILIAEEIRKAFSRHSKPQLNGNQI